MSTTGLALLLTVLALGVTMGWVTHWQRRPRPVTGRTDDPHDTGPRLDPSDLGGGDLGERATLVQFSSAFCAPCRATRVILRDVASREPGVGHIEIDAESHLDLVRRLGVLRTPTVLILDAAGRIVRRASGAPRKADVLAALEAL